MAPGADRNPLRVFLGDFTDECEGDPVVEFASGGAKNYGYVTRGGKFECKVRGFSLNYKKQAKIKLSIAPAQHFEGIGSTSDIPSGNEIGR